MSGRYSLKGRVVFTMSSASPPADGTRTRSYQRLSAHDRPLWVGHEPRATTIGVPSGDQAGWRYSPGSRLSFWGAPPEAGTRQRSPTVSSQLVKAIEAPSGENAGDSSKLPKETGVSLRGFPEGRS